MHRAQDLGRFVERAFWTACSGRPGAALVNVPMDVFSRPAEPSPAFSHAALPGLPAATAEVIAARLAAAERPLIYVGGGLRENADALIRLAEHLDIPIAHSLMAKGTVPDSHPVVLGMPGSWAWS